MKLHPWQVNVRLAHHSSAFAGDWWCGVCETCGGWGREVRSPDTARKWMENHQRKCNGATQRVAS